MLASLVFSFNKQAVKMFMYSEEITFYVPESVQSFSFSYYF